MSYLVAKVDIGDTKVDIENGKVDIQVLQNFFPIW